MVAHVEADPVAVAIQDARTKLRRGEVAPCAAPDAVLIAIGEDSFYPGFFEDDGIFDAAPNLVTEFSLSNGRATSFVIRGKDDHVIAEGTRLP